MDTVGGFGRAMLRALAPLVGLSMFWPLFRYASFVMQLYPAGLAAPLGEFAPSAHTVLLVVLALLTACGLTLWKSATLLVANRRPATAALAAIASLGAAIALAVNRGALPAGAVWISIPFVALGFLVLFCAWADWSARLFSEGSAPYAVALLGCSFLLSYLLFSRGGLFGGVADGRPAALLMPAGSALAWLLSPCASPVPAAARGNTGTPRIAWFASPLIATVAAFLVVGGAVRGIVDLQNPFGAARPGTSLVIASLLAAASVLLWLKGRTASGTGGRPAQGGGSILAFTLGCWTTVSLVFLGGLFAFLVMDDKRTGGDIVVVSRSTMELVFWMLLCDRTRARHAEPIPAFLAYGISVEILSWLLSYTVIPALIERPGAGAALSADAFVLAVIFGVASLGLAGFGIYLAVSYRRHIPVIEGAAFMGELGDEAGTVQQRETHGQADRAGKHAADAADEDEALVQRLERETHLTQREASVAVRYARGWSLGRVADELGISKSTAQSHIKSAYRKLAVHSKDELIERLQA